MAPPVVEYYSRSDDWNELYIHNHSIQFHHNSLSPDVNSQNSNMNSVNDNESVFQLFFDLSVYVFI